MKQLRRSYTKQQLEELREWYVDSDRSCGEFRERFGITLQTAYYYRKTLGLGRRNRRQCENPPTPEEIAAACKAFRKQNLARLRAETDEETQRRVTRDAEARASVRAYSFDGESFRQVEALA